MRLEWVSASEGQRFADIVNDMTERVRALGPEPRSRRPCRPTWRRGEPWLTTKLQIALYWGAACGGCDVAVLDTNEFILDVAAVADIRLWPIAVDGKYARRRGDGRRRARPRPLQRRRAQQRERARRQAAAPEEQAPRGLRLLRAHGRHPRPRQPGHHATRSSSGLPRQPVDRAGQPHRAAGPRRRSTARRSRSPRSTGASTSSTDVVDVDYFVPGCPPAPDQVKAVLLRRGQRASCRRQGVGGRRLGAGALRRLQAREEREEGQALLPAVGDHPGPRARACSSRGSSARARRPARAAACAARTAAWAAAAATARRPDVVDQGAKFAQRRRLDHRQQGPRGDRGRSSPALPDFIELRLPLRPAGLAPAKELPVMTRTITIDPITRLEGHGKIEIFLDDDGAVKDCFFQIPELRGFERFVVGRPIEELPRIVTRICGVCPASHHMASAKAVDGCFGDEVRAARPQAARHVLPRPLHPQPHRPLLRAGRPRLRLRARTPTRRCATSSGSWPRWASRSAAR